MRWAHGPETHRCHRRRGKVRPLLTFGIHAKSGRPLVGASKPLHRVGPSHPHFTIGLAGQASFRFASQTVPASLRPVTWGTTCLTSHYAGGGLRRPASSLSRLHASVSGRPCGGGSGAGQGDPALVASPSQPRPKTQTSLCVLPKPSGASHRSAAAAIAVGKAAAREEKTD